MNDSKISVRYSKALFDTALENDLLDNVSKDMKLISEICKNEEFMEFLNSPVIRPEIKSKTLHGIFGKDVQNITMSLIDLVVRNGRESYIPSIARNFMNSTKKHKGITECILTTARELSSGMKEKISRMISSASGTKVELKEKIDETIIGGFILKIDDGYIDASIRNKLRKIRKELTGKQLS